MVDEKKYVDVNTAMKMLSVERSTIYNWIKFGKLTTQKGIGTDKRKVWILKSEVDSLVEEGTITSTSIPETPSEDEQVDVEEFQFWLIENTFGMPSKMPIFEKFLTWHMKGLRDLYRELHPDSTNLGFAGRIVNEIAHLLEGLTAITSNNTSIMENESLNVIEHLEREIKESISSVKLRAQQRERIAVVQALRKYVDVLKYWTQYLDVWRAMHERYVECFSGGTYDIPANVPWVDFKEATHAPVWENDKPGTITWNTWAVCLTNPSILDKMTDFIIKIIDRTNWDFNKICPISKTSHMLGAMISSEMGARDNHKELILIDYGMLEASPETDIDPFLPSTPQEGDKILFIDTAFQFGSHFLRAKERVEKYGATVEGIIVLTWNDTIPESAISERLSPIQQADIISLKSQNRLVHLFKLSDLHNAYKIKNGTTTRHSNKT